MAPNGTIVEGDDSASRPPPPDPFRGCSRHARTAAGDGGLAGQVVPTSRPSRRHHVAIRCSAASPCGDRRSPGCPGQPSSRGWASARASVVIQPSWTAMRMKLTRTRRSASSNVASTRRSLWSPQVSSHGLGAPDAGKMRAVYTQLATLQPLQSSKSPAG